MSTKTQGSWFPSGYYGHFRSKSRNDFVNEYRQQAKPSPPVKFAKKLSSRPTNHQFSHHDNRFSFLNTVTSFQDGLGKKKVSSARTGKFTTDFIAWVPHTKEIKEAGPNVSVYRETFRPSVENRVPQILVPTIFKPNKCLSGSAPAILSTPYSDPADMTSEAPVTTYRLAHRHQQPNPKVHTNMNTGVVDDESPVPFQKTNAYINPRVESIYGKPKQHVSLTSLRRGRIGSAPVFRSSVADCLSWHHAPQTTNLYLERQRPKTVAGTFPEVNGGSTVSQTRSDYHLQPVPPQSTGKGTVCPTTSWGMESQTMPGQSLDSGVDTRQMGQTQNGPMQSMMNTGTGVDTQPASAEVPMAE